MFGTKFVQEIKTGFMFNKPFFSENRAIYEIMWKNSVEWGKAQMTIWRMCITCWITKTIHTHTHTHTHTHSEYVIVIPFRLQQW